MYAIIESCGRQYKVAEGDVVFFEKLEGEEGKKVTFDNVVLVSNDSKVEVGAPYVKGVKKGLDYFSTTLLVFLLPSAMVFTTMLMPRCNLLT